MGCTYAGLAARPWRSGSIEQEKPGVLQGRQSPLARNPHRIGLAVKTPSTPSALTLWFEDGLKANGGHVKKALIVALARKLLVALWKYVTTGLVIEGAVHEDRLRPRPPNSPFPPEPDRFWRCRRTNRPRPWT